MQGDDSIIGAGRDRIEGIWLKASVAGGLWAAVEIIAGSFLHNLRIPMAGSILALFGIILMTAFFQVWPERGLIWRAGLICALMKSISPSAVILGPMTGIMMEALLLETSIALLGKNLAGYLAGGALALFSALLHKFMSLLLLYGFNIITIYLNLFYFASRQVSIPEVSPWLLLLIVSSLYLAFGALAGFAGYITGKRALARTIPHRHHTSPAAGADDETATPFTAGEQLFEVTKGRGSIPLFILHFVAIPAGLLLINNYQRTLAYPVLAVYILFCILFYKNTIRRLRKPLFWFQLMVILLLAAVFLGNMENGRLTVEWTGVFAGVDMNIRALLVVTGFSAFGNELRNPLITEFLHKRGFRQLYLSVSLAFRALPAMMEQMSRPRLFFANPLSAMQNMVSGAIDMLNRLQNNDNKQ